MDNVIQFPTLDLEAKGFSQFDEANDDMSSSVWQAESLAAIDGYTLKSMFTSEEWVYILTDLIANECSTAYPQVVKKTIRDGKQSFETQHDHWLQKVLDDPCDLLDAAGFWYKAAVEYTLMGNWIAWYMRASRRFEILPAETVQIEFNDYGTVTAYKWFSNDPSRMARNAWASFSPDDIIHVRRPNPMSRLWGLSPFIPGRKSVLFMRYSDDYINGFYMKGAAPGVILETESTGDIAALKRFQAAFEQAYTGRRNHRRPLVLPKGVKVNKLDYSIVDQDFIDVVNLKREDIINLLHIPKHALSIQEAGSLGSQEHKKALEYMWRATIRPILRRFEKALTKFFHPQLGDGYEIMFDTSDIDMLVGEPKEKAETADKMRSTMTLNEIRATIWELPPLPGGDTIAPTTPAQAPFASQTQPTQVVPAPNSQGAGSSEPPALPSIPAEDPEDDGQQFDEEIAATLDASWFETRAAAVDDLLKVGEAEETAKGQAMEQLATDTLLSMLEAAMPAIKTYLKRHVDKGLASKASKASKAIPNEATLRRRLDTAMDELGPDYAENYQDELESTVQLGVNSQLTLVFNREARLAIEAITDQTKDRRSRMLRARGLESFAHMRSTTTEAIIRDIGKGIAESLPINQIAENLVDNYANLTLSRAKTIARTEVLTAVSMGQNATVQAALDVIPDARKVWITANDERVRHSHEKLHAKVVKADGVWTTTKQTGKGSVELRYPRDPRAGDPSNVINCRCTMALVLPDAE